MQDIYDIIKNIERIYDSTTNFKILKDFERVLDELNVYVYDNWMDGELAEGPLVERHWITCKFFWLRKNMPDPEGGKRLLDYNCKVTYQKEFLIKPRKIRTHDDIRPGTKKGKLDREAIWIVSITMPKKLIPDIYRTYKNDWDWETEPNEDIGDSATTQPADIAADPGMTDPGMADPGIDPALPADAAPAEPPAAGGTA